MRAHSHTDFYTIIKAATVEEGWKKRDTPHPELSPAGAGKQHFNLYITAWMCFLAHVYIKVGTAKQAVNYTQLTPVLTTTKCTSLPKDP